MLIKVFEKNDSSKKSLRTKAEGRNRASGI